MNEPMATKHKWLGIAAVIAVVVAAVAVVSLVRASGPSGSEDRIVTLTVGGQERSYRLFVPPTPPSGRYGLVVALHPLGNSGLDFEQDSHLDSGAVAAHALVAYPNGVDGSWNAGRCCGAAREQRVDDVAFLDAVIDDVEATYPVDPSQLAMGGLSNGALMHMHGMKDTLVPWVGDEHSPYTTNHVMPSVRSTTDEVANADGCRTGDWSQRRPDHLLTEYEATGCPNGASVTVAASRTLPHMWATGASSVSRYGVNETNMAWSFMLGAWR
jgi:poly(3-hydroxybutyrate) depolymerase